MTTEHATQQRIREWLVRLDKAVRLYLAAQIPSRTQHLEVMQHATLRVQELEPHLAAEGGDAIDGLPPWDDGEPIVYAFERLSAIEQAWLCVEKREGLLLDHPTMTARVRRTVTRWLAVAGRRATQAGALANAAADAHALRRHDEGQEEAGREFAALVAARKNEWKNSAHGSNSSTISSGSATSSIARATPSNSSSLN